MSKFRLRLRPPPVVIGPHAWESYIARRSGRGPKKMGKLAALVSNKLYDRMLSKGQAMCQLETEIDLGWIIAVLILTDDGWKVKTFLSKDMIRHYTGILRDL